jgi:CheY-like chemotaxis protein
VTDPVRVLLVEDDEGDAVLTQEAFRDRPAHRLNVVRDGDSALAYLRGSHPYAGLPRPHLVLLDLNLPGRDGRDVLAEIKSDPELTHIPVVVLTTSAAEEDVLRSYQLHASAFVTKPVDLDGFISAIRQIDHFFGTVVRLPAP